MSGAEQSEAAYSSQPRLLRTKLYVPRAHPDLVFRDRLARRLDDGEQCRLTLLSAPAGFGKTTLLSDWLQTRGLRPAWVSLDEGDNDPRHFWAYVAAALESAQPGVGHATLSLLYAPQQPPIEAILTELTNDLAAWLDPTLTTPGADMLLILDDYHAIQSPAIHKALESFLLRLPQRMRMIIASREDPPLPLALLRARRQLLELRTADLRFTAQEAAALLNTHMGLSLTAQDLAELEAHTEGWAAGLQLAALSMQGIEDVAGFVRTFAGSHRYVFDYLAQEVLERQAAPLREFLLQTAVLGRLSGPLCDAVTGGSVGQAMLERLEQANLFVVLLDQDRLWYRYHPLFAEFLCLQLEKAVGAERVAALHRRAGAWFEDHGLIEDAMEHALLARDFDVGAQLVEQSAEAMFIRSDLVTLCGWLAALPEEIIAARPRLSMLYGWALGATGRWDEAEHWAESVEKAVGAGVEALAGEGGAELAPQVRAALVEVSVLRGTLALTRGELPYVVDLMLRALPYLAGEGQPALFNKASALRPAALYNLAVARERAGGPSQASLTFAEAATCAQQVGNQHILPMALSHLARIQVMQGQLHQAERTYRRALEAAETMTGRASPLAGIAYTGLGSLLYERNDLAAARSYLNKGITLARPWLNGDTLVPGYVTLAAVLWAQGDAEGATEALDHLDGIEGLLLSPYALSQRAALRALLQIRRGDLAAAARWAECCDIDCTGEIPLEREAEAIIAARIWLSQGRLADAEQLLARLRVAVEAGGRAGRLIEVCVLQTMVYYTRGQSPMAMDVLRRALFLAEPEGWVRTFVDEGAPMSELLTRLEPKTGYVTTLLAAFHPPSMAGRSGGATPTLRNKSLSESLTERELDVLRLVAVGLSNQEIADRLIISLNTVKTHVQNLCGKLGAGNRTQAVARARDLGLLSG